MILKSISLKNIRSYRDVDIKFTNGITLLAGDIGAGKSTILLAIEFALFGISRSDLTGQALLRHGAQDGKVALEFSANGKDYIITRTLKRSNSAISQDNGYIETESSREILTPSELRAKVFTILGYPLQFLTKQKNMLYRFTMYTPQEEMKLILTQSPDERVETIRRIFGIDAYKQARDNAQLVAKAIKDRELQTQMIIDRIAIEQERILESLKKKPELDSARKILELDKQATHEKAILAEEEYLVAERAKSNLAQERQMIAMQTRDMQLAKQELIQIMDAKRKRLASQADTASIISQLESTIKIISAELKDTKIASEEEIAKSQSSLEALKLEEGKILSLLEQCKKHITIQPNSTCPTCMQKIPSDHIENLHQSLAAQEVAARKKHDRISSSIKELRLTMAAMQQGITKQRQLNELNERLALNLRKKDEDNEQLKLITGLLEQKEARIKELESKQKDVSTIEQKARAADQMVLEKKQKLGIIKEQLLQIERRMAAIDQELKGLQEKNERAESLSKEAAEKNGMRITDQKSKDWLMHKFMPFTSTIERHLLSAVHQQFDSAFRNWFSKLMEDESISARLDHDFTPIISQSGYEVDTANLSGGERTSVSLAWRLALVHTIHQMTPDLGTCGLIILDEPTDGFSSEQLERVRDVLQEIDMDQIILVSHEQQLEGFVDHILRVRKTAQGSIVEWTA